ncbi:MAG: hypothetical protein GXP38_00995 [Chloroflexi bacterium]|nr:hypothetical protein [Chloroflexota bacterium]
MQQASPVEPASLITIFIEMIAAPSKALQRVAIRQTHSWWLPILLAIIAPILYLWLNLERTLALASKQLELRLSALPPDQIEAARSVAERLTQANTVMITAVLSALISLAIGLLISTMILYFGAALLGAMPKLNQLWPAVAWTWLPFAFRGFLQSVWTVINQSLITYPGLSYFVASGDPLADSQNWRFVALSQIDLFSLWHIVLVFVLLRVVTRLGSGSAFVLTLIYAALNLALRLVPLFLGGLVSIGS